MVNELTLTIFRFGFLILLWIFILSIIVVLKNDLAVGRNIAQPSKISPKKTNIGSSQNRKAIASKNPDANHLNIFSNSMGNIQVDISKYNSITIGRSEECFVILQDNYASTVHCRIFRKNSTWYLEDTGSTNGTFINNQKVTTETMLHIGQQFKIGETILELGS